MTPRRRCQPGSGATRSESVFPTKREGPARRRRRHAMVVEALVPPGADRVATRIATHVATLGATVYTNAPKRLRGAILADLCTLLRPRACPQRRRSPTVYTNAPIRRGESRSSHLCTLLRHRPGGDAHAALAVTQPPTHTTSRSLKLWRVFQVAPCGFHGASAKGATQLPRRSVDHREPESAR